MFGVICMTDNFFDFLLCHALLFCTFAFFFIFPDFSYILEGSSRPWCHCSQSWKIIQYYQWNYFFEEKFILLTLYFILLAVPYTSKNVIEGNTVMERALQKKFGL
jgi:hypothetical protein